MRWSYGRVTLLLLGVIVVLAVGLGILFGTDLVLDQHPVPFPLIAGGAALAALLVLRLRGNGPGNGQGGPGPRP
jgi:hypothetical protein